MAGEFILIVDDEELIRRQAEIALRHKGYRTAIAGSGKEALLFLQDNLPDVMLCDIRMPDMDGLEFFQQARQIHPDVVGVLMTAHGSIDNVIKALHLGISGFLLKPFTANELDRAIFDAMQRSRQGLDAARQRLLVPLIEMRRLSHTQPNLVSLCQAVVESLARETASDYCSLFLRDLTPAGDSDTSLKAVATYIEPEAINFNPRNFPAGRVAARVMELGRILSLRRAEPNESMPDNDAGGLVPGGVMGIPLLAGERSLGVLMMGRSSVEQKFSGAERDLFELLAGQLGAILDHERLKAALEERNVRMNQLAARFVMAQEEEKRQLSEKLQNMLTTLTGSRKNVQSFLQRVRPSANTDLLNAEESLHGLINDLKRINAELRPPVLDEYGISAALRQYAKDLNEAPNSSVKVSFKLEGDETPRLDYPTELILFRAVQDAMFCFSRVAGEKGVTVGVRVVGQTNLAQTIEFQISDGNPANYDDEIFKVSSEWYAMQERLRRANAAFYLRFQRGEGNHLFISYGIPVEAANTNGLNREARLPFSRTK